MQGRVVMEGTMTSTSLAASTRPGCSAKRLYDVIERTLDTSAEDVAPDRMMDLFGALADRYDTNVSSPYNMGYFCLDADTASLAALYETDRRAANIGVEGQHPTALMFELYSCDIVLRAFGIDPSIGHAHYTSGGTEANLTAMIVALGERINHRMLRRGRDYDTAHCKSSSGRSEPYEYSRHGILPLKARPAVYVAPQTHASILKNARTLIGTSSVRVVPMDDALRMDPAALERMIVDDRERGGYLPFLVVGTVGSTASGIIDPLPAIGKVCRRHGLWLHVDAPWGGIAAFSKVMKKKCLAGIELADSITFDPHKTLVPLGSGGVGMFLTRHRTAATQAFNVSGRRIETYDYPYMSLQGSRVGNGLRVLSQLVQPRRLAARIEREAALGNLMRQGLRTAGWTITNDTPLPVVTAIHPAMRRGKLSAEAIVRRLARHGVLAKAEPLRPGEPKSVRLGVISRRTREPDVEAVVAILKTAVAR